MRRASAPAASFARIAPGATRPWLTSSLALASRRYGRPDGTWRVELPAEEVPPELPEPALGINFARDGMQVRPLTHGVPARGLAWPRP